MVPVVGGALVTVCPPTVVVTMTPPSGFFPSVTWPEMEPFPALSRTVLAVLVSPPPSSSTSVAGW